MKTFAIFILLFLTIAPKVQAQGQARQQELLPALVQEGGDQAQRDCPGGLCCYRKDTIVVISRVQFLFDQAMGESISEEPQNYCQKCKRESRWCPHRKEREVFKTKNEATITTYQNNHTYSEL